jgi:hypothetical protein
VSKEIKAVHVVSDETRDEIVESWTRLVGQPARDAGLPVPELVSLDLLSAM